MAARALSRRLTIAVLTIALLSAGIAILATHGSPHTALADDSGFHAPTANSADLNGDGNGFEVSPELAYNDGGGAAANMDGIYDRHQYRDFNLNIPSGATINGIEVRLDWWAQDNLSWSPQMEVELSFDGGVWWTRPKQAPVASLTERTDILGAAADTWGRTWTSDELSNKNFRVRIISTCSTPTSCQSIDWYLDYIAIKVTYTVAGPTWTPTRTPSGLTPTPTIDPCTIVSITTIAGPLPEVEGVQWDYQTNKILYDQRETAASKWHVYQMDPDGSNKALMFASFPNNSARNAGNANWRPVSRDYILFQAENYPIDTQLCPEDQSWPGRGVCNNLWVSNAAQTQYWNLTNLYGLGVLWPRFSHDGTKIAWAQLAGGGAPMGKWDLKVADFVVNGGVPSLQNIRTFHPGAADTTFFETNDWSHDSQWIFLSTDMQPNQSPYGPDGVIFNPATGEEMDLTTSFVDWEEHGHFSPNGLYITMLNSRGLYAPINNSWTSEIWMEKADGSEQRQLTYFNYPGQPGYTGSKELPCISTFSQDGTKMGIWIQHDTFGADHQRYTKMVTFAGACGLRRDTTPEPTPSVVGGEADFEGDSGGDSGSDTLPFWPFLLGAIVVVGIAGVFFWRRR